MTDFYTPPPFRVCPDCGGSGKVKTEIAVPDVPHPDCRTCHGTGRIPIYYTIPKWEELTKRKVPDDLPVWWLWGEIGKWSHNLFYETFPLDIKHDTEVVIATEAGNPKDWRPE